VTHRFLSRFARGGLLVAGVVLLLHGAATPFACGAERAELAAAVSSITSDELKTHVDILADDAFEGREAGSRGGRAAGNYLLKAFEKYNLEPAGDGKTYFQSFNGQSRNILGMLPGSDEKLRSEVVLIGAHYDHVGYGRAGNSFGPFGYVHNGADDNASGVAGLLEVLDAIKTLPTPPRRSILFCLWDAEEQGLIGSKYWASRPPVPLSQIVFAINLDMIGRLRNKHLEIYGSRTSTGLRRILSEANRNEGLDLDFDWKMKADSDHWSFIERSIPTVMFHTGLHDNYHRPSDDTHLINSQGMQQVARVVFATLDIAANRDSLGKFRAASRSETPAGRDALEQPVSNHQPRFGIAWTTDGEPPAFIVHSTTPGSPAEKAGLKPGDQLLKLRDEWITNDQQLRLQLHAAVGPTSFEIGRAGEESHAVTLDPVGPPVRVGITWREDPAEPGAMMITQIIHGSAAHYAPLKLFDRVYAINGHEIATSAEFSQLLNELPGPLEFLIDRHGQMQTVQLDVLPGPMPASPVAASPAP
jgi:hypothetical protein